MEFHKDTKFLSGRFKSIGYAFKGAYKLISTEHSIMSQSLIAIVMTGAGIYFKISHTEWMFQILAIGLILSVEGLNTAVEKLADFVHPDFHDRIGFIKDIAAGAVLFAGITALGLGLMIYLPKIMILFQN